MSSKEQRVIRLLLADDHPIVRTGLHAELARHPGLEVIGEAVNGNQALQLSENLHPDVLLLDINMPGLRALDVMQSLRHQPNAPRVIVLSAYGDSEHVIAFLAAGAKGYIVKNEDPAVIADAVRAVAQGILWLSPSVAQVVQQVVGNAPEETPDKVLTPRELEVLRLMAQGWDNQTIGHHLNVTEATVKFHIGHIYDKLGVSSRVEALLYAARHGLVQLGSI